MNTEEKIIRLFLIAGDIPMKEAINESSEISKWVTYIDSESMDYLSDYNEYSSRLRGMSTNGFVEELDYILSGVGFRVEKIRLELLWCLIYISSKQRAFSEPQKALLEYLVEKWEIDKGIFAEFIDTAETIKELSVHKERLIRRKLNIEQSEMLINEAEKSRLQLLENIKMTLLEVENM